MERDNHFKGVMVGKTDNARSVISEAQRMIENYEKHREPRCRKRSAASKTLFDNQVEVLISELVCAELRNPNQGLMVSLSNQILGSKNRYKPKIFSQTLPDILRKMSTPEMGFLTLEKGFANPFVPNKGIRSVIRADWRIKDRIASNNLTLDDFAVDLDQELIILKKEKDDLFDNGKWISYKDTEKTITDRANLRQINLWLQLADISIRNISSASGNVDLSNRFLRRIFNNGRFDQGGRLFGGFWQNMRKEDRHDQILINGMDIVELDYGQIAVGIMYGVVGVTPAFKDAYEIPKLEGRREGVKKILNAMTQSKKPLSRFPKGSKQFFKSSILKISEITDLIMAFHKPIAHLFYTDQGMRNQYQESEIMVEVLIKLISKNVTALPIHDAILVAETDAAKAKRVMRSVFKSWSGFDVPVTSN